MATALDDKLMSQAVNYITGIEINKRFNSIKRSQLNNLSQTRLGKLKPKKQKESHLTPTLSGQKMLAKLVEERNKANCFCSV